jgi:hypothetical protein
MHLRNPPIAILATVRDLGALYHHPRQKTIGARAELIGTGPELLLLPNFLPAEAEIQLASNQPRSPGATINLP